MSVKHKPLHWYCTLLSEIPSFSYNSPLVNQTPVCYFKSKYPVNMTDAEWLQVFEKKSFMFWSSSLPPYVHMVGGKGRMHICYCEMFIIGRNLKKNFMCSFISSYNWRHCIKISQIRVCSARNDTTSDNWVLPIIERPPVVTQCYRNYNRRHIGPAKVFRSKLYKWDIIPRNQYKKGNPLYVLVNIKSSSEKNEHILAVIILAWSDMLIDRHLTGACTSQFW